MKYSVIFVYLVRRVSLPLRECGLKFLKAVLQSIYLVTPLAGVWIEINKENRLQETDVVTPLAGVWIEISKCVEE